MHYICHSAYYVIAETHPLALQMGDIKDYKQKKVAKTEKEKQSSLFVTFFRKSI